MLRTNRFRLLARVAAAAILVFQCGGQPDTRTNSLGMHLVRIPAGHFLMGETAGPIAEDLLRPLHYHTPATLAQRFPDADPTKFRMSMKHVESGDYDERPARDVAISKPFYLAATEVTNAQYEAFDPEHRKLRGRNGFSKGDDEAVVFVTWDQANAFCSWLSKKEGHPYRLPTEGEWEYACRAGTRTLYSTGNTLPPAFHKNARSTDFGSPDDKVPLTVGRTPANPWGLFDMHGNVEEWCRDWYGPYDANDRTDPVGRIDGDARVTRGGSHGTPLYYLRSANRMGSTPDTANWLIGFRVAMGEMPSTKPLPVPSPQPYQKNVSQKRAPESQASSKPYFDGPRVFVKVPPDSNGPLYSHHNHDTALAECPNGDLLAIWYTCVQERGRELAVAVSRLRRGSKEWDTASSFWDLPDRNDHCPGLWYDGKDTIYHFNGLALANKWAPLAIVMRTSQDNGVTWSKPRLIAPEFDFRNMVAQSILRTKEGAIVLAADIAKQKESDPPRTNVWVSRDNAQTWTNPDGVIPGVHASVVELNDGRLMALGRGVDIDGRMPQSFSSDLGRTWTSVASALPPISGGQRSVLVRLREGAILLVSFAASSPNDPERLDTSLFAAASFDEGKTWPLRRVISPGNPDRAALTLDGSRIRMNAARSEPLGYCSAIQSRDGLIHVISSINHYTFNLAWLKEGQPAGSADPSPKKLPRREKLLTTTGPIQPAKGFTIEARLQTPAGAQFDLEAYSAEGFLLSNRYRIRITSETLSVSHNGSFQEVARLENKAGAQTFRFAIRDDTAFQIWREGTLLATLPAEIVSDRAQATRGSYVTWKATGGATVIRCGYDPAGAFAP